MVNDCIYSEISCSTSGSDSENDNFEYRRKRVSYCWSTVMYELVTLQVRRKKVKSKTGIHIQTQSLLSSLPTPLPQDSLPSQHTPSSCRARPLEQQNSIPAVNSCVVFPPLVHFSAPPKLSSCPSWKFVDKYKGRSNGGIPMFSEERIKERAQKVSCLLTRASLQFRSAENAVGEHGPTLWFTAGWPTQGNRHEHTHTRTHPVHTHTDTHRNKSLSTFSCFMAAHNWRGASSSKKSMFIGINSC